ncbi:hypothetical protein BCR41DRAFT_366217 [Lobosporangium transversale]|uniref:Crinkler effector protein N-terminal domain-containing protein n=1 Tax=Lobosporangium transversale TaxID=64571 RepID=A0A1Y2FZD7_9FUNG|nr:hypothetical protein BCR41DRAFT_366217 [Lobosporangium transversale]ORY88911.1 hypothetical protein BCR41DRAFT_366217 [Lobosporangium transversale]|eukprot:XP_021875019.1 hypothetical protein BCR41DRAFT_366217 [Lobosporangium transversale]
MGKTRTPSRNASPRPKPYEEFFVLLREKQRLFCKHLSNRSVGELQQAIKAAKKPEIDMFAADKLTLYKTIVESEIESKEALAIASKKLGNIFNSKLPDETIHIFVKLRARKMDEDPRYISPSKKMRIEEGWREYRASDGKMNPEDPPDHLGDQEYNSVYITDQMLNCGRRLVLNKYSTYSNRRSAKHCSLSTNMERSRVIFTGTAHAKYELQIMEDSARVSLLYFVGPLSETVFSKWLEVHLNQPDIVQDIMRITNRVPREFIPLTRNSIDCDFEWDFRDLGLIYRLNKNRGAINYVLCLPAQKALFQAFTNMPHHEHILRGDGEPVTGFKIVYMRGSPDYKDLLHVSFDELKEKLFKISQLRIFVT